MRTHLLIGLVGIATHFLIFQELEAQMIRGDIETQVHTKSLSDQFSSYNVLNVDFSILKKYTKAFSDIDSSITISFIVGKKYKWDLEIEENPIITNNTIVRVKAKDGTIQRQATQLDTYKGKIKGLINSQVRLNVNRDYFSAYISDGQEVYVIEPLNFYVKSAHWGQSLFYKIDDLKINDPFQCAQEKYQELINEKYKIPHVGGIPKKSICNHLEISFGIDYLLFENEGSDVDALINLIGSVLNLSSLDYENIQNDSSDNQVSFEIREFVISTCKSCDPWTHSTDALEVLNDFQNWTFNNGFAKTFDVAGFWTNRDFDGGFAGLAFQGQLCSNKSIFSASKFSSNLQALRIMTSHEIGHTFNCFHNYEIGTSCSENPGRDPLIMDPIVNPASVGWSDGTQACALNAIEALNNSIQTANCLDDCNIMPCESVQDLNVLDITGSGLSLDWSGNSSVYRVSMREEESRNIVFDEETNASNFIYSGEIASCINYVVNVESNCDEQTYSASTSIVLADSYETKIEILDVVVNNCEVSSPSTYGLDILIKHGGGNEQGIIIDVAGDLYHVPFEQLRDGIQHIALNGLNPKGIENALLQLYAQGGADEFCEAVTYFDIPDKKCNLLIREQFNDCKLPYGWISSTSNTLSFINPFEWKVSDEDRPIQNYGIGLNAGREKTIDGTCLVYMDDDVNSNQGYTGTITLLTTAYDLTQFIDVELSLVYNFHKFEDGKGVANNSKFLIEVFNGTNWVLILDDEMDFCPWFDVWNPASGCFTYFNYDITPYMNDRFQVRFTYSDGADGKWTGMVGFDNFQLTGTRGSAVPLELVQLSSSQKQSSIYIEWETQNELLVKSFGVERAGPELVFQNIGMQTAQGYSLNRYKFEDISPIPGINYYRLRTEHLDGSYAYSEIVSIDYSVEQQNPIEIYPNPVGAHIIHLKTKGNISFDQYTIYDVNGTVIMSELLPFQISDRTKSLDIDLHALKAGVYFLRLSGPGELFSHKIVKL